MTVERIILVTRKTRLEELICKYNTVGQAKFYIEHLGQDFSDYLAEHDLYKRVVDRLHHGLASGYKTVMLDRAMVGAFMFDKSDLVYICGQDGLVANTLKYLEGQTVAGINPDPSRWAGVLLPFGGGDAILLEPEALLEQCRVKKATLGKVTLPDGQKLYAVNDFFIGQRSHVSSRYELVYRQRREKQSSSGIIVSTGLGSTGWLKSVISGASRISRAALGAAIEPCDDLSFDWSEKRLVFSVREPYISPFSGAELVFGAIDREEKLEVISAMPEGGAIFSDGMESDFIVFSSGMSAVVEIAEKEGMLLFPK